MDVRSIHTHSKQSLTLEYGFINVWYDPANDRIRILDHLDDLDVRSIHTHSKQSLTIEYGLNVWYDPANDRISFEFQNFETFIS